MLMGSSDTSKEPSFVSWIIPLVIYRLTFDSSASIVPLNPRYQGIMLGKTDTFSFLSPVSCSVFLSNQSLIPSIISRGLKHGILQDHPVPIPALHPFTSIIGKIGT